MLDAGYFSPVGCLNQSHFTIVTRSRQPLTIRAVSDRLHLISVWYANGLFCISHPFADSAVFVASHQQLSVRAEGYAAYSFYDSGDFWRDLLSNLHMPELRGCIRAHRNQITPIRAKGSRLPAKGDTVVKELRKSGTMKP